jgi:hypothetical protein
MQSTERRGKGHRRVSDLSRKSILIAFLLMATVNAWALFVEHQSAVANDVTYNLLKTRTDTLCQYNKTEHDALNTWINSLENDDINALLWSPAVPQRNHYLKLRIAAFDVLRKSRNSDLAAICGQGADFK